MLFLTSNLKTILAVMATLSLCYGLHAISMGLAESAKARALTEQALLYTQSCETDKARTKEANDALQKSATDIATKLAQYKRLHPSTCIVPHSGAPEPASGGNGHAGQDGISSDWLVEYSAECETYRQQRITLESFFR